MRWAYQLVTGPTIEPITDAEAVEHLRLPSYDDVSKVQQAIRGARWEAEKYMSRGLLTQTWKYAQDGFTSEIWLPMAAPLQSVTTVKYYDTAGTLTTLSSTAYLVDTLSEPGRVYLAPNQVWPSLQSDRRFAVEITYVVGWTEASLVPGNIIDGLYLAIGDAYEHRESTVVGVTANELPTDAKGKFAYDIVSWVEPCERAA
jgi:uncharacterized phiE125 gp8 family phage protein